MLFGGSMRVQGVRARRVGTHSVVRGRGAEVRESPHSPVADRPAWLQENNVTLHNRVFSLGACFQDLTWRVEAEDIFEERPRASRALDDMRGANFVLGLGPGERSLHDTGCRSNWRTKNRR